MLLHYGEADSPLGKILFASDGEAICALDYLEYESRMMTLLTRRHGTIEFRRASDPLGLTKSLDRYFAGDMQALDKVPIRASGSVFQEQVWNALRTIPVGETWSYGKLAAHLGRPQSARAVGHANSLNPVAIVVPCHRVIGASKSLTGYAGGLERKRWLLSHEGVRLS